ncbi:unnamed protein product [Brassicogethes aeneus]|uniref:OPA3-like protein CG13603 n=1 Tax=Brassicogethes aeneus TaxID=1431903 RepID=A0A9P0FCB3_BRAAE|nr:unnamed protein product [Brassicogethes aeneus]
MVVGAFPAAKLGALLLKQISKPIANVVKSQAKQHPFFRKYICMPPAQLYNWCEVRAKMWMLNLGKPVNIPVLNEAMAIELGANLLGEGIIFIIAAGILLSEYNRSSRKEEQKEAAKKAEMTALTDAIRDLFIQSEEQGAYIRELTRKMGEIETNVYSGKNQPIPSSLPASRVPLNSDPIYPQETVQIEEVSCSEDSQLPKNAGLILNAVNNIEHEFWNNPKQERTPGILTMGLSHIHKNVLRIQV